VLVNILGKVFISADIVLISVLVFDVKFLALDVVGMHDLHDLLVIGQNGQPWKVLSLAHESVESVSCGQEGIIALSCDAQGLIVEVGRSEVSCHPHLLFEDLFLPIYILIPLVLLVVEAKILGTYGLPGLANVSCKVEPPRGVLAHHGMPLCGHVLMLG
jgi:hypothetical protein